MPGKKKITIDPRVEFLCNYIMKTMNLKIEKWQKMYDDNENKELIMSFIDDPGIKMLSISINNVGMLMPYLNEFPSITSGKGKICYFIRREEMIDLTPENMTEKLMIGDISQNPINDLSILGGEAYVSILANKLNHIGLPEIAIRNVNQKLQELRNSTVEIRGNINNTTILPLPITITSILKIAPDIISGNIKLCTKEIKTSIEEIVIKWANSIEKVLQENSFDLFLENENVQPNDEIQFWNIRMKNLTNIYEQLCSENIKTVAKILEKIDSIYFSAFQKLFIDIVRSLSEARNITLFLGPLQQQIDLFSMTDFNETKPFIEPLIHMISLIWSNSQYYCTNERMVHLFKLIHNMLIQEATVILDPGSIFQGEVDECLIKINVIIDIFMHYKTIFEIYRNKLPSLILKNTNPQLWTFKSESIFKRLDRFVDRLNEIKEIFQTANEFLKLEKVEIGGLQGRKISRTLNNILEDFNTIYVDWSIITFDPLDIDSKKNEFKIFNNNFMEKSNVLERKLATQIHLAFDECVHLLQMTKLIQILGTLMHRKIIFMEVKDRYSDLLNLFSCELKNIKDIFDNGINEINTNGVENLSTIDSGYPIITGTIKWIRKLIDRIQIPFLQFSYLDYNLFDDDDGKHVLLCYESLINLLNDFENTFFLEWRKSIPHEITTATKKSLLIRNEKLINENYDPKLAAAIKETKILKFMEYKNIPTEALKLFDNEEDLWKLRLKLFRIVEWYNKIMQTTEECEYNSIEREINALNNELKPLFSSVDWTHYNQENIDQIYNVIKQLHERVLKSQENIKIILDNINSWATEPLYIRKIESKSALLNITNRKETIFKRLKRCIDTKKLIVRKMDENFRLFNNLPLISCPCSDDDSDVEDEGVIEEEYIDEDESVETIADTRTSKSAQTTRTDSKDKIVKTKEQIALFRAYEEYVDNLVAAKIIDGISLSMKYIKNEIENRSELNLPLFQVKFELQQPDMRFIPNLDSATTDGFLSLIESLIFDIYSMCDIIPRIAQPPESERCDENGKIYLATYESKLSEDQTIEVIRQDIITNVKLAMVEANGYVKQFHVFEYLWIDDRQLYLEQFLKYGKSLSLEENQLLELNQLDIDEIKPTIDMFKMEIDKFKKLETDIQNINDFIDFEIWFRVICKGFKFTLLNEVADWIFMFKNYLKNHVIDSLQNLEDFCEKAFNILAIEIEKDDFDELLNILSVLNEVEERQNKANETPIFEPLRDIVEMLKMYHIEFDDNVHLQFSELPVQWLKLKKTALIVTQAIAPIQTYQVDLIQKRILLFSFRCRIFRNKFKEAPFFKAICPEIYEFSDSFNNELIDMEIQLKHLSDSADLFDIPAPETESLVKSRRELKLLKQLWDLVFVIRSSINNWKTTPWKKINVDEMQGKCKIFVKDLRGLDNEMRRWDPYIDIDASVKNLMTSLRAVTELQNPAIRERHWQELMSTTKVEFHMDESTTLSNLLDLNLHKYEDDVKNIVDKSIKEMAMEKMLKDFNITWKTMAFEYEIHTRTNLRVIKSSEELIEILEDNQIQLQNMLSSKFVGFFLNEVLEWQNLLSNADQVIDIWFDVQRKWMYLESIFVGSDDIRKQLPVDTKRFDGIDYDFKKLLKTLVDEPNVVKATNTSGLYEKLEKIFEQLTLCEKALNDYLETKRLSYPRFYFVSSADLLDILSNGNQPELVVKHLPKLYDSLAKLKFKGKTRAYSMTSKENEEHVEFTNECDCTGQVEIWLNRLTDTMRETLRNLFAKSVKTYEEKARDQWIFDWPAQPTLCTTQIWWSTETNDAFAHLEEGYENALKDYQKKQINQLNALIVLLLEKLSPGDRQKIMTVCTIDVHSRDVVAKLITQKVENALAFQWQCQLRHSWNKELSNCYVNICDAHFQYDFEYLGNTPRLVITPLTDRCYITLTQSLHLIMGSAPAGPAGTGKTETTKDLGKGLGIMVYVFNCSEQMDYKSCGNIYKGLSQTGAWGCFDEFNRISIEVLSVVAVQVKTILDAIKNKKAIFQFLGEMIKLTPTVGLFITMNPGYAGRTELPENLKALFRPCAMVVPDFALISEIMLVAEGFQEARLLSRKFITLYTLCKELLSKQDHYDWGLRAIKSVLVVAGALRRSDPNRPEDQVLMRALRDFNIPKISTDDVPIFMGLIGDLFPNLDVPRKRDEEFEKIVQQSARDLQLQPEDGFVLKIVQLKELFEVRHSVFIVGFSGTGKTEVWKTLHRTYSNLKLKPHFDDLNPKAVTNDELFGIINPATREWKDGLFSFIMRDQVNMRGNGPKWIVLDGDIDPMWIESLNTLMDDNKILTLASNERISLTKEMRLLFEIASLRTATPATVSRAGILYINPQDLGWNPYVASWIDKRELKSEKQILSVLFDKYIPPLLDVMKYRLKKITPISEIAQIQMTCHLLDCLLTPQSVPVGCPKGWYEIYFTFAIIWGFGSALFQDQIIDWRNEFNKWWMNEFKTIKYPTIGTVFNYYIDPETKEFMPWTNLIPSFELDIDIPLQSTLVNTADTTCLRYFMDILIEKKHPVMLVGGSGSGKSVIVYDKLNTLSGNYLITNVPFNFYTTSDMLQQILEKPLEKKAGRNFGPPGNKTMIYFVDDMNMPEVDMYGTVQPHTLIRQFMDYSHWYDRTKLTLKGIHNCQFVSCMNPTAGSFTINPRLQRHFCTFAVNFPGSDSMYHIYNSILSQHLANPLNKFNDKVMAICETLIKTAITLHQRMNQLFLPTAVKFHYIFNLRDMANIYTGMMFGTGECCPNPNMLIRLWVHEVTRVYGDKLVDNNDIDVFKKLVTEVVRKGFDNYQEDIVFRKPLLYFHFAENLNDCKYMPVKNIEVLSKVLEEAQANYNELIGAMNLVLFEDAMSHICRISRILANDRGYALLIGVGGSGKQSLTRLAAFITSLDVFQTQLRKGFNMIDLKADLANLYMKAGVKNSPCCYLMTDSQVAEEQFLVLINDLLASGEIPDLFAADEIDNIIGAIRNEVKQARILDTKENCWKFFIDKVRRMLKVVLCFSPVGSTLRVRSRKFPAIVNCTAIDWFHEWPKDALESVSQQFLAEIEVLPPELVDSVSRFMAYVHGTVNDMSKLYLQNEKRYNYTTPKSFLELISLYSKLLNEKQSELVDRIMRLENGLLKLADCSNQVAALREQLKEQEIVLAVKNAAANKQHAIVSAENKKVQVERDAASATEKEVRIIEENVSIQAKICAADLKKAEPVMLAAIAALDTLDKKNLTELKSFGSPPQAVVNVCAAVLVLMCKGKIPKDRSWKACKIMMGKVDKFLDDLKYYDKKNIPANTIAALLPYINDPEFVPDNIRSKSGAAGGLCEWVINIYKFYEVYLDVGPKERALNAAESELKAAQDTLSVLNIRLSELQEKLDVLQAQLDAASAEKEKCQAEADKTEFTIQLAYRLVDGLASENVRWRELVKSINKQIVTLPGDILLISCFISYVGCFTRNYRLELQNNLWLPTFKKMKPEIPVAAASDPLQMICDDAQIAFWNNEGLPTDRMSAENATILTNSARWPLIIDPQLQGIKWIKQRYGEQLIVTRLTTKSYLDVIEKAISNGDVLLIENIGETIEAVLDPLLGRALIKKGKCLKIGDKEIDYNAEFQLILHTKLANPHYKPEMQAQTTLINFTVTRDGLEEQLLAEVVKAERPDLEELKTTLTTQQNNFKITLKILEEDLLQRLSSAGENVLEDETLVLNLEKTKKTSGEIEIKVTEAKATSKQIDQAREGYRPAASRASTLYFILNDLCKINRIYQFSLKAFTVVFHKAIVTAAVAESINDRVLNLIDSITFCVYMYTSRALFEQDKIIFMAQMTIQILLKSKKIDSTDLDFLLRFPYTPNLTSPLDFITNIGWGGIVTLSLKDAFKNLDKDIEGSHKRWKKFTESDCPEREKLPGEWKNKNALQKLCIMRALRPDRMTYAVMAFVEGQIGSKYVEARMIDFVQTFTETSNVTHIFFTLSAGVDPLKDIEKLGKKMRFSSDYGNFHNVSLGQGQEIVAENAIDIASKKGHWVILQNIHLVAKWLPTLEKKIEATLENSHENYRLFLSAEPAASAEYHIIPQGVLESAIKITNEPPTGMLANLHKALDNFQQDTLEMCTKEAEFKAILFALCYFHAVVAERRKFGPQGWNRVYPFNFGDLTISVFVLYNYLEANSRVPWEDLRYLFGEIMYGGHITDDWDRRLCNTYLEEFMQGDLIDGDLFLAPNFLAPPNIDYIGYHKYIDDHLPPESPYLYGLHPNAEIGVLTTRSEEIFKTIFELQPRESGATAGASVSREEVVKSLIEDIVDKIPDEFNMFEIMARVDERTPYIIVAFQECERMNILMREVKRSLTELFSGLEGELTITPDMEKLEETLYYDVVPENWTNLAYPSLLGLQSWFADLILRLIELESWSSNFKLPSTVWLAGFFNPQSFLTAIMQQTARKNSWPLDRMCLNCDVTKKQRDDFNAPPREGAYIHGLFMEGARWDMKLGTINDSILKELFPAMPVLYLKAVTQDKQDTKNVYECPVYKIRMRGPTFVWTFNLKSKQKASKWTMAGVCLLLQV